MGRKDFGRVLGVAVAGSLLMAKVASAAMTIETVHVGDVGNAGDTLFMTTDSTTGYGRVNYAYNIGKYEVTAGQYAAFLNAVAKTDTYALYNPTMSRTDYGSGIAQTGSVGSYAYSVDPVFVNRPVNYVSFWDACRFTNWLQNGQPTGAQGVGTTETGAYTLTSDSMNNNTITRNPGTTWAVTSEDEWYKAAYYKGGGTNAGYYLYPTSSDTAPGRDLADASGNNANFFGSSGIFPIDSGKYTTLVGEFQNSDSPYGTFDQGGNVWEWNEAKLWGFYRGVRGGWFNADDYNLRADYPNISLPASENKNVGFRVSQVPEPAAIGILGLGVVGILVRRRGAGRS